MRVWTLCALSIWLYAGCLLLGCPKVEQTGYDTVVAAKAFCDKLAAQHPECALNATVAGASSLCVDLHKAVAAKDALIDAMEVYCAGPSFNGGGACSPPAKGTPALTQATAKIQAAMSAYSQAEKDLKGVIQ